VSFYPQLDNLTLRELIERFHGPPDDEGDSPSLWYEEIAWKLKEHGKPALDFLWSQADARDAPRRKAVLFGLSSAAPSDPKVRELLLKHLHDRRPLVVAEAIDGLSFAPDAGDVADAVLPLQNHPSPYVRGAVLRFMRRVRGESARALLISALDDKHHVVRANAVDELDELGDPSVVPVLRPLLDDPHAHVRDAACTAIENLERIEREQAVGAS
jgi:HEAT repeat protein